MSQQPGMCCWLGDALWWLFQVGVGRKSRGVGPERVSVEWERAWLPGISLSGRHPARDSFAGAKIEEHICVCVFHKHSLPATAKIFCPVVPGKKKKRYCYHYNKEICLHIET